MRPRSERSEGRWRLSAPERSRAAKASLPQTFSTMVTRTVGVPPGVAASRQYVWRVST
jgi:hypothetical protein